MIEKKYLPILEVGESNFQDGEKSMHYISFIDLNKQVIKFEKIVTNNKAAYSMKRNGITDKISEIDYNLFVREDEITPLRKIRIASKSIKNAVLDLYMVHGDGPLIIPIITASFNDKGSKVEVPEWYGTEVTDDIAFTENTLFQNVQSWNYGLFKLNNEQGKSDDNKH